MEKEHNLTNAELSRYGRQIILPQIGPKGQERLKNGSVLVVGGGGLGCPLSIYLAAAGVGRIGVVDFDSVELTNLHRQILHTETGVGTSKADSVANSVHAINSSVKCNPYNNLLSSENALEIISEYDVVADCTDNPASRYLINDACVLSGKPLVSGSALRWEGQLTIYNCDKQFSPDDKSNGDCNESQNKRGPCYRCLFPEPPAAGTVTNCSEGGVLGPVVGVIGSIQASETIKLLAGIGGSYVGRLFLYDALHGDTRTVRLRGRMSNCAVCGDNPTITRLIDYEAFCGTGACDKDKPRNILAREERISVEVYHEIASSSDQKHLLVDVRPAVEYQIGRLPGSTMYVICHKGNDSQETVQAVRKHLSGHELANKIEVKDVVGGLESWATNIDTNFPLY